MWASILRTVNLWPDHPACMLMPYVKVCDPLTSDGFNLKDFEQVNYSNFRDDMFLACFLMPLGGQKKFTGVGEIGRVKILIYKCI